MKKWCAVLAATWGLDLALRWQGHLAAPPVPGVPLWAGLQLVSEPGAGLRLTGLGALSSTAVLFSLALLAAGAFVLAQAVFDLPRDRLCHAGLLSALGAVAWTGLDLAESLVFGGRIDTLAWQGGSALVRFGLGDLVLPLLLVALAACLAVQLWRGLRRGA
ncbi:hypothetical protein GCM10011521_27140 [Arenimonas soli]|uniref:Uncharacterized protein n=1 Tax=Arenimonas soli TaxID=2269504 RepID=A0ABQ1HRK1_9GAMM|nr:hypothetical protein [Arenimonas soli]GGA87307.1 hypothetical protein GCM10011521_27140 [Arenimonas soli]